jgi:shikimate dehydrogenase
MQTAAFAALGLDHTYELADLPAEDLPAAIEELRHADFLGANVTVPHKSAVIDLLDEVDNLAASADAVNTIVNRDGRLTGSNTDIPAIIQEVGRFPNVRRAVVLGAGGAAKAVLRALEDLEAQTVLVSRSGQNTARWSDLRELVASADLVVNATPVGTDSDESPLDARLFHQNLAILDLVYRPSPTRLVHDARMRGLQARAGAGVLLGQGWRSLEAWLGIEISTDVKRAMADALAAELGEGVDV